MTLDGYTVLIYLCPTECKGLVDINRGKKLVHFILDLFHQQFDQVFSLILSVIRFRILYFIYKSLSYSIAYFTKN